MSKNSLVGQYLGAGPVRVVGKNNLNVRSFWLDMTTNPEYPNTPEFQLSGDRVNLVDKLKVQNTIEVHFNVRGTKWEKDGKKGVAVNLDAWKIERIVKESAAVVDATIITNAEEFDDLPF